jgi:transcription-repair coupling factor (superfamily II helicase)
MQTADSLGAGFTVASHDMDSRGFGNLIGDDQSGHVKEVGVELYQEMLDIAIANLKNEPEALEQFTPIINLGLSVLIPESFIADSNLRLGLYRRIGALTGSDEIENFKDEIIDRFGGPIPAEFNNLLNLVAIKQVCYKLKIMSIDSGPTGFVIKFLKDANIADMVISFVQKFSSQTKLTNDNKLIFIKKVKQENIVEEVLKLLSEFQINSPS